MSLTRPILTLTCWALAPPQASAAASAASPKVFFMSAFLLVVLDRFSLAAHQRAVAFLERPEGLVRRNGSAGLIEVAGIFRLFRLLYLEQIGRVNDATIGADRALAEQRIIGRHLFHLRHHGLAVGRTLDRGDRLQVVQDAGIDAGMVHGRIFIGRATLLVPALGPGAASVVQVPVPGLGQEQAL